jgi:hypothetical protein
MQPRERRPTHPELTAADVVNLAALGLLCATFMSLRWVKLEDLLWGDPVHWLHEVSRVAAGDTPYRDFSFQYPPLTAYFFGWGLRYFGKSFMTAQILADFWSLAVVFLSYALMRYVLPRTLHLPVGFMLTAVGVTSLTNFNLFSFRTYTPALQSGAAGALLSLWGMLECLRRGTLGAGARWMIIAGSFLALLSKVEYAFAQCCALLLLAAVSWRRLSTWEGFPEWFRSNLRLILFSILPASAVYLVLAWQAGPRNLMAGISGYGLATFACPWWPTGVGVFGAAAAVGEAIAIAVLLSLPWRSRFIARFGSRYLRLCVFAVPGALIFGAYKVYQNQGALMGGHSAGEMLKLILPSLLWSTSVFLPVMWTAILAFVVLSLKFFRSPSSLKAGESIGDLLIFLVFPVAMCPRALFGTTQSVFPEVAAVCYPFVLILGPYFLWRFLSSISDANANFVPATLMVAVIAISYGMIRLIGGASLLTAGQYHTLETEAGRVRITDYDTAAEIYAYVTAHTAKSDYVLELPYGGGVNFASGRPSPIFDTQLYGMAMPARYQEMDLRRIQERKPKLIIVEDSPQFGTYYGYGLKGNRACVCPRLVWMPDRPSWDPSVVYPVVQYISRHYRPALRIGGKAVLVPLDDATSATMQPLAEVLRLGTRLDGGRLDSRSALRRAN